MSQRPRFKVPNHGMGRKSWVIAILQRLKPCIIEKYASFLGTNKDGASPVDEESFPTTTTTTARTTTKAKSVTGYEFTMDAQKPRLMPVKLTPAKCIWSMRQGQEGEQRLPAMPEPRQLNQNANQPPKKQIALSEEQLKLLLPINRYINFRLQQLKLLEPEGVERAYVTHLNVRPQFVMTLPEPLFGSRIELDLEDDPAAFYMIHFGLLWKEHMAHNPNARRLLRALELANQVDDNPTGVQLNVGLDNVTNALTAFLTKFQPICRRNPNQSAKVAIITYFVVFCVIGFLFTLFL